MLPLSAPPSKSQRTVIRASSKKLPETFRKTQICWRTSVNHQELSSLLPHFDQHQSLSIPRFGPFWEIGFQQTQLHGGGRDFRARKIHRHRRDDEELTQFLPNCQIKIDVSRLNFKRASDDHGFQNHNMKNNPSSKNWKAHPERWTQNQNQISSEIDSPRMKLIQEKPGHNLVQK